MNTPLRILTQSKLSCLKSLTLNLSSWDEVCALFSAGVCVGPWVWVGDSFVHEVELSANNLELSNCNSEEYSVTEEDFKAF